MYYSLLITPFCVLKEDRLCTITTQVFANALSIRICQRLALTILRKVLIISLHIVLKVEYNDYKVKLVEIYQS